MKLGSEAMSEVPLRPAVFLDRDGVLNRCFVRDGTPHPPAALSELEILPRVPEALALLREAGLLLVCVTNQPDVARGAQSRGVVEEMNQWLLQRLPLDALYVCWHDNADNCLCRKPRPGLLTDAARDHAIDLPRSFIVGDRWSDVVAGRAAGCATFLIDAPYSQADRCNADYTVSDLYEAAQQIATLRRTALEA